MNKIKGNEKKEAFRKQKTWIDFSKRLRREHPFCACCGTKSKRLQVHHMKPDEYDRLDPSLFAVLCSQCHKAVEHLAKIKRENWYKYDPFWVACYSRFLI